MQSRSRSKLLLSILILLLPSLACRAATRMIVPDTPTPLPPTHTPTMTTLPTVPPSTATPVFQTACPSLLAEIMVQAAEEETDSGPFPRDRIIEDDAISGYLVKYVLKDGKLRERDEIYVPDDFEKSLDTRAAHEWIWNYFAALIPASERGFVTQFSVMTDGHSNILAGVGRTLENPAQWELRVDVVDASNHYNLTYTLAHEFGHLLTLKPSQVAVDKTLLFNPDNEEYYDRALSACPGYFTQDGCSSPDSYINEFHARYWQSFYEEWQVIDAKESEAARRNSLHSFYRRYADQFLTEYAVTSPEEDIAESWAFFILAPKPEPTSISNEKILFFYEYPELVQLRQEILTRLCTEFPY